MLTWKTLRAAMLALVAPLALGASHPDYTFVVEPQSRLWISGTSTLRSFECDARTFDLQVHATGAAPVEAVLEARRAVTSVAVRVPAAELDCHNGTMNKHMLKALKADQHGEITFDVDTYELIPGSEGALARLTGTLAMGGASKAVVVESEARAAQEGVLHVVGRHEVTMSELGLKRPSLMLGTLKVGDKVIVHFDLYLKA
ncbi:MAG: hypothetical protein GEU90_18730 [Gemmatimonas sp.]|nr:hypothetical protein [Gemmatimonas sp.]